jgi:hypothetical protein
MIKILRKLLLIDFVISLIKPTKAPHLRFAGFLTVFSYMWFAVMIALCISVYNSIGTSPNVYTFLYAGMGIGTCFGFFFFYRYISKILKSYSHEDDATRFHYLRFINPVAPAIYISTVLLIAFIIVNIIMAIIYFVGALFYLLGIVITFGLLLLDKDYKYNNFVSLPKAYFESQDYFFEHYISPEIFIIFFILIYFVIPFGTSLLILIKHSEKKSTLNN